MPIWHDSLLFLSTYCNAIYILKFGVLMKVLEFKIREATAYKTF